jgi:hypothetical protein
MHRTGVEYFSRRYARGFLTTPAEEKPQGETDEGYAADENGNLDCIHFDTSFFVLIFNFKAAQP